MIASTYINQAAAFPIGDWQFWIVSVVAASALAFILWRALGKRLRRRRAHRPRRTSATLTIEGRAPRRPR